MNHVIHLLTRQKIEKLVESHIFDPYSRSFISLVREVTGMSCVKGAVQSDNPGDLYLDGSFEPTGPWNEMYQFGTTVDPLSALNVASFSGATTGFKYVRIRYVTNPSAPLGINFDIDGALYPVS
jgi:hypothetical protein